MALTVTSRGSGSTNTGGQSTLVVTPTGTIAAGSTAVVCAAYDNSGTLGADPFSFLSDTQGNLWSNPDTVAGLNDPGAASAGMTVRIFSCHLTVGALTTSDTITLDFGGITTVARAWTLYEVAAADGSYAPFSNGAAAAQTSATPSITTASLTSGDALIACVGREANGTRTADNDATNGQFTNAQNSGVGSTTSGAEIISESKVVTGTATQTYNPTFGGASADGVNAWASYRETIRPRVPYESPMQQLLAQ